MAAHLLGVGFVVAARAAWDGVLTTTIAALALALAAVALLRGRTWGALLSLAVGASFATAAALSMTNAPAVFTFVAIVACVPAALLARPMWRFDRAAAAAAIIGAALWGASGAALLRASPDAVMALGAAEAAWDLSHDRVEMRFCGAQADGYYEDALATTLGVSAVSVECGESPLRDAWNAGYDAAVREDVEARCGAGAIDAVLWSRPRCR